MISELPQAGDSQFLKRQDTAQDRIIGQNKTNTTQGTQKTETKESKWAKRMDRHLDRGGHAKYEVDTRYENQRTTSTTGAAHMIEFSVPRL